MSSSLNLLNAEAGTLSFALNREKPLLALRGLPKDAEWRPWARLAHAGDRVRLDSSSNGGAAARRRSSGAASRTACMGRPHVV